MVSDHAPILGVKLPDQHPLDLIDLFNEELRWTKVVRPVPRTPGKISSAFATKAHCCTPKAKYLVCFLYKHDSLLLPLLKKFQAANKREVTIKYIKTLEEHKLSFRNPKPILTTSLPNCPYCTKQRTLLTHHSCAYALHFNSKSLKRP
jgi:hypothetical protein